MKVCDAWICSDFICINLQRITSEWQVRELTKPSFHATIINEPQLCLH